MIGLIDSHIHLDDARFEPDRDELLTHAQASGVSDFILPAVSAQKFNAVNFIAENHESVHAAYGLHPYYIAQHRPQDLDLLASKLAEPGVVAVGECGLDFHLKDLDQSKQLIYFEAQVSLAKTQQLPLILHVRGAVDAVFKVLQKHQYYQAVMHSFNGSVEQAKVITETGVFLGFGPAVCNPKARKLKQMVESVSIEHILLETDAPDQPFFDRYGQRNLPVDLLRVNQLIADIKGIKSADLASQTRTNIQQLFKL